MKLLTEIEKAYYSGLLDGEGSIFISKTKWSKKSHISSRRGFSYILRVVIKMTDEDIIKEFQSIFGGSLRHFPNAKTNWKPLWEWNTCAKKALSVLQTLLPYLKVKRKQAELGIVFQKGRIRGGRMSNPEIEDKRLERLYQQMKKFNKRGV